MNMYNLVGNNPSYNYQYNGKELQSETGWNDYGWRQYMPEIGRWNGMDQLSENYYPTSPFAYVANNPISSFDVDGRWFNQDGSIDSSGQADPFRVMGRKSMMNQALGMFPEQRGGGSGTFGETQAFKDIIQALSAGGTGGLTNIDGILRWWTDFGQEDKGLIGSFNMLKLKSYGDNTNWDAGENWYNSGPDAVKTSFNWVQNNPGKFTSIAGIIQAGSTIAEKGFSNWNAPSSITKSRIFAETISTKLPTSAKFLERASTALKWGGRIVGAVGVANTLYQGIEGNISGTRAVVDGVMGVAGFFPATAWVSLGYFAAMAIYETYYNDGKPAF